jgi:hypothetical protein
VTVRLGIWEYFSADKGMQTTLHSRSDITKVNEHYEIHFKLCCLMEKMRKNEEWIPTSQNRKTRKLRHKRT